MKKILTEFFATFLMLCAIVECAFQFYGSPHGLLAGSVAAGIAVTVLIYIFGSISGAHMNPAVSIGFAIRKELNAAQLGGYVGAQLSGALGGAWLIFVIHDTPYMTGTTDPAAGIMISWWLEAGLTFLLMYGILFFADPGRRKLNKWTGVAVGLIVFLEIYFAGNYSGASMNPARSFGPTIVSGSIEKFSQLLLYFTAPVIGAALAAWIYRSPARGIQ